MKPSAYKACCKPFPKRPTVEDDYAQAHVAVVELLNSLLDIVHDMPAPEIGNVHYGHVGSLKHVKAQLLDLHQFLSGGER